MKLRHTIFNSTGLGLAGISGAVLFLNIIRMARINGVPSHHPIGYAWVLLMDLAMILFVGGGAIANLTAGRLKSKPTMAMIIVYFLTCVFLPMGIWGIIELRLDRDRGKAKRGTGTSNGSRNHSSFKPEFLRRAATFSWVSVVAGFVIVLFCGSSHVRPLINFAIVIFFLLLISSFVLGLVALLEIREHGKKGILIPALTGVCISGFFILMGCIALVVGMVESAAELRQARENAMHSSIYQTNAPSRSQ